MAERPSPSTSRGAGDRPTRSALLEDLRGGGRDALDRAVTLLYDELREIAHRLRVARREPTVDTLTLVHEAYLKLADDAQPSWNDRAHFLALAAVVMRHVLTDQARARHASKREGDRIAVPIDEDALASPRRDADVLELVDALERLERTDERLARVVEYRFFGGLTNEEIGTVLGVDARTVRRDWVRARALLHDSLFA
ncbi:MAG TPA: ECF-type sigma factor [Gemmatimonadaceae bacterium]